MAIFAIYWQQKTMLYTKNGLNFEVEMQDKAGTKCDNYISGPDRKDGALGGYKL